MPENISGTETLSGGAYQIPSPKDRGVTDVFEVIEDFMIRMANHGHDGKDSHEITLNFDKEVQNLVKNTDYTWDDTGNSILRTTITLPEAASEDNMRKYFFKMANIEGLPPGELERVVTEWTEFYPSVEKIDATKYYLYSNNPAIDNIRIVYF